MKYHEHLEPIIYKNKCFSHSWLHVTQTIDSSWKPFIILPPQKSYWSLHPFYLWGGSKFFGRGTNKDHLLQSVNFFFTSPLDIIINYLTSYNAYFKSFIRKFFRFYSLIEISINFLSMGLRIKRAYNSIHNLSEWIK